MMNARKVDEYMAQAAGYQKSWLTLAFDEATIIQGETSGGFFNNIWIPTRQYDPTTQQLSENYTYYNVGCTTAEMADIYWTEHSGTYLIGHFEDISQSYVLLQRRIAAIFKKNLGKYKKLIELEGLIWNPLWNVDGEEIRQLLENNGTNDVETGQINTSAGVQWNDTKTTHEVTAYDSDTLKKEYEDKVSGNGANIPTGIQRVEFTNGDFTVSNQSPSGSTIASADESTNGLKGKTKYVHNLAKNLNGANEEDYIVDARDTAFGQALKGADKMHVEKLIRHGNIGVTKTTELIEDARKAFRYTLLDEFFKDIDEVILVGVYGDYMSSGEKFYHHFVESAAEIDHIEIDKYGHIVGVFPKGESIHVNANQIIFGNRLSGQT